MIKYAVYIAYNNPSWGDPLKLREAWFHEPGALWDNEGPMLYNSLEPGLQTFESEAKAREYLFTWAKSMGLTIETYEIVKVKAKHRNIPMFIGWEKV